MTALVVIDTQEGMITRYLTGGAKPIRSHRAGVDSGSSIAPYVIEEFRVCPPDEFKINATVFHPVPQGAA